MTFHTTVVPVDHVMATGADSGMLLFDTSVCCCLFTNAAMMKSIRQKCELYLREYVGVCIPMVSHNACRIVYVIFGWVGLRLSLWHKNCERSFLWTLVVVVLM